MHFLPTAIPGAVLIEATPREDARGSFTRLYCPAEFAAAGLGGFQPTQMNLCRNPRRHTLRGMHFQPAPHAEAKLVRVLRGRAQDVVIDLRPDSPSYLLWASVELDEGTMNAVFIPEGCAHGYLTLEPHTDVLYQMGHPYVPGAGRGVRWNDPRFAIPWVAEPAVIDPRDAAWPDWQR